MTGQHRLHLTDSVPDGTLHWEGKVLKLQLGWLEHANSSKKSYPQVPSLPLAENWELKSIWIWNNRPSNKNDSDDNIWDNMKLTQLVRVQNHQSRGRRFDSGKSPKTDNSNLQGFEVHRPLSKDTRLLRLFQVQVKQTIINQPPSTQVDNGMRHMKCLGQRHMYWIQLSRTSTDHQLWRNNRCIARTLPYLNDWERCKWFAEWNRHAE